MISFVSFGKSFLDHTCKVANSIHIFGSAVNEFTVVNKIGNWDRFQTLSKHTRNAVWKWDWMRSIRCCIFGSDFYGKSTEFKNRRFQRWGKNCITSIILVYFRLHWTKMLLKILSFNIIKYFNSLLFENWFLSFYEVRIGIYSSGFFIRCSTIASCNCYMLFPFNYKLAHRIAI